MSNKELRGNILSYDVTKDESNILVYAFYHKNNTVILFKQQFFDHVDNIVYLLRHFTLTSFPV